MLRKKFLQQMAYVIPATVLAPQALVASESNTPKEKLVWLRKNNMDAANANGVEADPVDLDEVQSVQYENGAFVIALRGGRSVRSTKILVTGLNYELTDYKILQLGNNDNCQVEFGEASRSRSLLSLSSYQLPQLWIYRNKKQGNKETLKLFAASKRAAVLQLV
jgi:hypothetical protein